jgi:hypothetical protein
MIADEKIVHSVEFPSSTCVARVLSPSCRMVHRRGQAQLRLFLARLVTFDVAQSVPETTLEVEKEGVSAEQRRRSATERGGGGNHGGDLRKLATTKKACTRDYETVFGSCKTQNLGCGRLR